MLTDSAIRAAKSKTGQTVKLSDGGGLQLWVQPSGSKLWNLAYRFAGKQRKLAIGSYPGIGLKEARAKREEAKKLLTSGFDPSQQKRLAKLTSESQKADPTSALRGAMTAPIVQHRAAIVEPLPFGALLRAIDGYDGTPEVRSALQLLALTFTRPGELRLATWKEFDLDAGVWTIPATRMKMRRPHRVPLAPQAISVLEELRTLTGQFELLFPGVRSPSRPLSENTLNAALRRLGYAKDDMSSHGFRAAASSLLNECGKWNADAIEAQLAHVEANAVRKAYARAEYWAERVEMMAYWAGRLDELRRGGIIVPLRA
jgi:integrase